MKHTALKLPGNFLAKNAHHLSAINLDRPSARVLVERRGRNLVAYFMRESFQYICKTSEPPPAFQQKVYPSRLAAAGRLYVAASALLGFCSTSTCSVAAVAASDSLIFHLGRLLCYLWLGLLLSSRSFFLVCLGFRLCLGFCFWKVWAWRCGGLCFGYCFLQRVLQSRFTLGLAAGRFLQ